MGRKHRVATQLAVKNHGLFDSCMGPAPPAHHRSLGKWNGCPRCRACTSARLSESLISHSFPQTRFSYYIWLFKALQVRGLCFPACTSGCQQAGQSHRFFRYFNKRRNVLIFLQACIIRQSLPALRRLTYQAVKCYKVAHATNLGLASYLPAIRTED